MTLSSIMSSALLTYAFVIKDGMFSLMPIGKEPLRSRSIPNRWTALTT